MNGYFRKFLWKNILVSLILLAIGTLIFVRVPPEYFDLNYLLIIPYAFLINLIEFKITAKKSSLFGKPTLLLVKTFLLKLFAYLGVTVLYLFIEENKRFRIIFVLVLFFVYTVFAFLQVIEVTRVIKAKN